MLRPPAEAPARSTTARISVWTLALLPDQEMRGCTHVQKSCEHGDLAALAQDRLGLNDPVSIDTWRPKRESCSVSWM